MTFPTIPLVLPLASCRRSSAQICDTAAWWLCGLLGTREGNVSGSAGVTAGMRLRCPAPTSRRGIRGAVAAFFATNGGCSTCAMGMSEVVIPRPNIGRITMPRRGASIRTSHVGLIMAGEESSSDSSHFMSFWTHWARSHRPRFRSIASTTRGITSRATFAGPRGMSRHETRAPERLSGQADPLYFQGNRR